MKRPLCRFIAVALTVMLCSVEAGKSNANRNPGVHTGPHWSSATAYETTDASPAVEAKSSKPKKHNGGGGKHDSGADGKHPDNTDSKTAKTKPASNSWGSPEPSPSYTKSDKESPAHSMSYAKTYKGTSDSKADKGEAKSYKEAPNEYNGVKMVVKTPEGGYKQTKAAKDTETSKGSETGESSGKPMMESKAGKPGSTGDSDGSWNSGTASTIVDSDSGTVVSGTDTEVLPDAAETTTTTTTSAATAPAMEAPATEPAATTSEAVQRAPEVPQKRIEDSSQIGRAHV